jgi:rhodanese-related sulfurtransferase
VVPRITPDALRLRLEGPEPERPAIVDVRLKYPFEHSSVMLPGAVRAGPGIVDPSLLPRDREILLYDSDPDELVAEGLASRLIRAGFRAAVLHGGISAWVAAKLPTVSKPAPQATAPAPGALKG